MSHVTRHTSLPAFTLIEVLLVVLIIGILAATGFSSIGKFTESASAGSARDRIISMINKARSYALNGRDTHWCSEASGVVGATGDKKVPESYGVKIIFSGTPQKLQLLALDSKNPPSPCIMEERNLFEKAGMLAKTQTEITGDQEFYYSVPFGDFSMKNPPAASSNITINIYPPNADENTTPLRTVTINKNIGIPE